MTLKYHSMKILLFNANTTPVSTFFQYRGRSAIGPKNHFLKNDFQKIRKNGFEVAWNKSTKCVTPSFTIIQDLKIFHFVPL